VGAVEVNGYTIEPGADLREADLRGAKLTGAFRGADLTGADLTGADLTVADLTVANLTKVKLNGAFADTDTQWPEGFDPVAAGVIFED